MNNSRITSTPFVYEHPLPMGECFILKELFFKIQNEGMIEIEMDDPLHLLESLPFRSQTRLNRLRTILP